MQHQDDNPYKAANNKLFDEMQSIAEKDATNTTKEWKLWFQVFFYPYLFFGVVTLGGGFLILPLAATWGIEIALTGTHINAIESRSSVYITIVLSIVLGSIGMIKRKHILGKVLVSAAFYLWSFAGVIGLAGAY